MIPLVASSGSDTMATTLDCTPGDTDYLKTVLLRLYARLGEGTLTINEGCDDGRLALRLSDGGVLSSSNEICRYLCAEGGRDDLCGGDPCRQALVDYWLGWEAGQLKSCVRSSLVSGRPSHDLLACLGRLEGHLNTGSGRSLVGDQPTLADIVVWSTLYVLLAPDAPDSFHGDYPRVCSWFISLAQLEEFTTSVWKASSDRGYDLFRTITLRLGGARNTPISAHPPPVKSAPVNKPVHKPDTPADSSADHVITAAECAEVKRVWSHGLNHAPRPVKRDHPILPLPGERNILITSALPYVNNVPHLGNIIGCVLSADVFARYCRLRNYNILYICGTDEYGTATETKALEEGISPQEICQKYHDIHVEIYKWFNIQFDHFGRTSTPQQTQIAQDIFWRLKERDFISEETVEQLQCQQCNMFLADRFVEGICPFCSYEDARGDQCDKCGKLINAIDLKSPRCKVCSRKPRVMTSDHLFLDLFKLEKSVDEWFQSSSKKGLWSVNAEQITRSWLRDGLKPRCITRDLKWGTPVPLQRYTDKVFYVWFDAPIGYLSITACYTDRWEEWWKSPENVQCYQFMAKDNVPFHTVVFPASLLGADDHFTLLNHISATEYLNYEDGKFSKSRGVGVFGTNAKDTGIPADIYRFYLLYVRPESQDSSFSWDDFVTKNNSELLNNLGNFVNRVLMFIKNNFGCTIPEMSLTDGDIEFVAMVTRELRGYLNCLENLKIRDGLRHILAISRHGNVMVQGAKPWVLVKGTPQDKARAGCVLGVCANVVCLLSVMLQPYMPQVSRRIQEQLQVSEGVNVLTDNLLPHIQPGHRIGTPEPLFTKIEDGVAQSLRERFAGKQGGVAATMTTNTVDLQKQLDDQAVLVRQLKSQGGVAKDKVDKEVKKLLELKSKLGVAPAGKDKKSKKGKK
ncbi:methionine--tRNA ligase, cytoplasmic-like isoform X2 [Halichondria panicea]|uniref:methionine--tRNA ligase, cytoplasmic-like isoform X2 n=1 Tax=Halichondria panicea TaxID=6063 RepID=UPI00312BB9E2